jgi:hypothetical protein
MPDQYDIDYNQQIIELLPPDKRYQTNISLLTDWAKSSLQYLRDAILGDYRNGSTVSAWTAGTYARNAKVNYKKGIYVSLVDGNTADPTNIDNWYLQQTFFIGLDERLAYNGNNLVLTYALNRWFGTVFRQPGSGVSDIYITTNAIAFNYFKIGYTEAESTYIGWDDSDGSIGISDSPVGTQYNANINVPAAVYAALQPAAEALIRSFVDMYIYAGITYQIVTY